MDDPSQENIELETNWVIVDPIDIAEEATVLDASLELQKKTDLVESDVESDGISVISESSHLQESTTDDEHFHDGENSNGVTVKKKIHTSEENMSHSGSVTWTFVNSEVARPESPLSENSSKQFYLNCLQEPVQELSEHELGSIQSDLESDSISVISECESLNENQLPFEVRRVSMENTKLQIVSRNPGIHKYFNGLMIGTILLASGSIFLGQYLNINDFIEEELPSNFDDFVSDISASRNEWPNKYNVPTALSFCKNKHKADGVNMQYNVKKCLKKIEKKIQKKKNELKKTEQIQKMEKHLKIKELYLGEKEKFLIKKEYELLKVEMKLKKQHLKKFHETSHVLKISENHIKPGAGIILSLNENERGGDTSLNFKGENHIYQKHFDSANDYSWKHKETHKKYKKYRESNRSKDNKKPAFSKLKYTQYDDESNERNGDKDRLNFKEEKDITSRKDQYIKKTEKCSKNTPETQSKNSQEKKGGKCDKNRLQIQSKNNQETNEYKNYESGNNYLILENGSNETISGYWVGKLYKARSDLRNKEHLGDWYFDRASYRKRKRDKAGWYFDWMMDREVLRYKRTHYI